MYKNCNQKQKYTKSHRSMITSNILPCQNHLIDRFDLTAQDHLQANIVLSQIKQVKFPEIRFQKNKQIQISQNLQKTVQNAKKISKIYKQSLKSSHICNFQDKLIFGKFQKSKSQVNNPFMQRISEKRKKQHKFSLIQNKSLKQNSLKKNSLNSKTLRKNQKEYFSVQKKKEFEQIQDIIQKQKSRLKLPSFVRNLKYMQQNQSEAKLNQSESKLNHQTNEIKIEKQMISIMKQRKSRLVSKISQRFYRINDTNEKALKQSFNTDQINKNKIHKRFNTQQNQSLCQKQDKILLQTGKSSILCFKNWQNKQVRHQRSKPSLKKYHSKANVKLLQNSLKIRCFQNPSQISQNDIFEAKLKRVNTNKEKIIKLQKVKKVQRSKTDSLKQNNALESWQKASWNQQPKQFPMQQSKISTKKIQSNLNQNQKNIKVNLNNSTANIKAILKLRLKQLNQTKSQTWQSN